MAEEVLNLSTIVDRLTISITSKLHPKGKLYELVGIADLNPFDHAIIYQRNQVLEPLRKLKKLTPAQERQVKKALDDTVKLICPSIEPSVFKALKDAQKQMIVFTWSAHLYGSGAAEENARSPRTTAASSRGSRRSTAATPRGGSARRRTS